MKRTVNVANIMAGWRWGERLGNDFESNKRVFWREVKRVRKSVQERDEMVKDLNGQILREGVEVKKRWAAEYFDQVLNVEDVREANINASGDWRMPLLCELNEITILIEEVREAVNEITILIEEVREAVNEITILIEEVREAVN